MGKQYRKYEIDENILDNKSEKQSYFLGFFVADGHLTEKGVRISSREEENFENLKKCLKSSHKIHRRDKTDFIHFHSKKIADTIREMGFKSNKTRNLIYPENVIDRHFIRGYFDGDGHATQDNGYLRTGFTSVDQDFLEKLKNKLEKEEIRSRLYARENSYRLTLSSRPSKKLYEYMYPAEIYLSRKKKQVEEYMSNLDRKTWEPDEIKYLRTAYKNKRDKEIAEYLDRTPDSVEAKRLSLGLKKYDSNSERKRDEKGRFV